MATSASRRVERLAREVEVVAPPQPSPEETRRDTERFFDSWAADIVRVAHLVRERRARSEERDRPISTCSALEIMAEAVSYRGHAPPESVRAALLETLNRNDWPEITDPETLDMLNAAPREALRRAFVCYVEETGGGPPTA